MTLAAPLLVDCTTVFDIEHLAHRCRELEGCRTHRPRMAGPYKLSFLLVGGLEYRHPAPTHIMCLGLRSGVFTSPLAGHLPRRGCLQRRCSDSLFNKEGVFHPIFRLVFFSVILPCHFLKVDMLRIIISGDSLLSTALSFAPSPPSCLSCHALGSPSSLCLTSPRFDPP